MTGTHPRCGLCVLAAFFISALSGELAADNISLSQTYSREQLGKILLPRDRWHPFPRAGERAAWEAIPGEAREAIIHLGEEYSSQEIPHLPATLYLEYRRTGNRSRFQDRWFERRKMLQGLVLAECAEGKGRFLDPLADIIWAICEESSWTFPAHIGAQKAGVGLPDTTEPIVALFSAETASALAWTHYLLREGLDTVSRQICPRILREVDGRILTPYLERRDFGWMGFNRSGRPNNWNPWINSNVLASALLLERDESRRLEITHKVLRSLDNFLVPYPADGSCDEGPSYWGRAGASLFDNLELLHGATAGKVDIYGDRVIQEIGRFILRAHIAGDYYVNVGDCDARIRIPRDLVFRYGRRIGDPRMQDLACSGLDGTGLFNFSGKLQSLGRTLPLLFNAKNLLDRHPPSPPLLRDVWLGHSDLQLMAARDTAGSAKGFFLAAWAGHNGQSHNHNDVGNFILYVNGRPFIIDTGRPTYNRQTFSRDRYRIWAMQSAYHNLPTINGCMQGAGRQYAARDVRYRADDTSALLEADLAPAYPRDAGIITWNRAVRLERGQEVEVSDTFQLKDPAKSIVLHILTPREVSKDEGARLSLQDAETGTRVLLRYEPESLDAEVETIELKDPKLLDLWGPRLHRILLKDDSPPARGACKLHFRILPSR